MKLTPGRPRGNQAWAKEQILAGYQVRKVIWPPGPYVELGPGADQALPGDPALRCVGMELGDGAGSARPWGHVFRGGDELDDVWERHPPAPAVPTLHAPILWILFLLPGMGGPNTYSRLLSMLESGAGSFVDHLQELWTDAGNPSTGATLVAAVATIDRALFHKSLLGDLPASLRILETLALARMPPETP